MGKNKLQTIRLPQLSLSSASFYAALLVIVVLGLFVGTFWAFNEYVSYQQSIENIRENYQLRYQKRVLEELEKVIDFVEYKKSQQDSKIEEEIRDKVQSAYSIASHVYSLYKDKQSIDDLRRMVVELLRPIRWDNGLGYYFAGNMVTGRLELFADMPQYEGVDAADVPHENWKEVVSEISRLTRERGAGKVIYNWTKPETSGTSFQKISFVKQFSPFDWFIGAGVYVDEMEDRIQKDILERIQQLHFGDRGEVLVFRLDGTIICSPDRTLLGRTIQTLIDAEKSPYGARLLSIATQEEGNGFIEYTVSEGDSGEIARRLGFVQIYPSWNWVFVTSMSMSEMERAIAVETATYKRISFKNSALFVVLFSIAVFLLLLISYFYSLKIKNAIDLFTEFFRRSADSKVRIEQKRFSFKEFEVLGEYANRMNEDRLAKEELIKNDEMRLDTLHRVGIMEGSSFEEIYDFALRRIAEITGSEAGYIATIECGTIKLQSVVVFEKGGYCKKTVPPSAGTKNDNVIEEVIQTRQIVFLKNIGEQPDDTFFPVPGIINQRIDVPVFDNSTIAAVLGLCNKEEEYGENDLRQITLMLEGIWLHLARMTNRKEMRRLRQLLKSITDSMPSVLIGIDTDTRIMQWNRLAEKKTGIAETEAHGHLLFDILPRMERYKKEIAAVISRGMQTSIRRVPLPVEGEPEYESITIYPINFEGAQGAVLRLDDVTESVRMEDLMIQSEKMLSVGALAAGIAHEINNPLASVIQNHQVMQKRLSRDVAKNISVAEDLGISFDDVRSYLQQRGIDEMVEVIGKDSRRAAKLVHNMLSFSRKSEAVFSLADIRVLLDNALALGMADYDLKKNYDFKQIRIEKDYEQDIGPVSCEETNIQQVFLNVIRNAAHAIAENAANIEVPSLILRVRSEGDMARIEFEDNGIGIDSTTRKRIFEPFFTTKGVGKGTGLGLSISYFIVNEQHHGTMEVRSEPGRGAVFVISLPFRKADVS